MQAGWMISKGQSKLKLLWNSLRFGTSLSRCNCRKELLINIFGDYLVQENTPQNQRMMLSSKVLLLSVLPIGSGNLGLLPSVVSSCGWQPTTDDGRRIDLLGEVCPIRPDVPSVIKRRRTSITYLLDASSLDNSGSLFFNGSVSPHSLHSLRMFPLTTGGRRWKLQLWVTCGRG